MKLSEREVSYLCGFIDGDGSFICQIVRHKDYCRGFYIRISINFHQKSSRSWFLLKLKRMFGVGRIHDRKDGMSVYTIVEKRAVEKLLILLSPHLIMKKSLSRLILRIIEKNRNVATDAEFLEVCEMVDKTAELTDSKKREITSQTVRDYLISRAQTENQ